MKARHGAALAFCGVLLLAGCTTEKAAEQLNSEWIGRAADDFFVAHGPPQSSYDLADGRKIYAWQSVPKIYTLPATSTTSYSFGVANTSYSPAADIKMQCSVQLTVQPNGIIFDIKPTGDSIGEWAMSRCSEIFAPPPPTEG
ncbi:hypothetical protein KHC23_12925 [Ancylobacter dichloromethanicus]|uniref:Lipoprotein n=1 Tax=Ancylobacter dichloromethanicus TaxID=518825 RepID=A0A9W6J6G7_9HYPH|nr:hypothetical protein [Ancylobacter dichloromethanicus]MBS7554556.1 hypothetical protein [Ancylobacter dichloromethanicus]GLK71686.1 hypothetical protein GCM10017643_18010 [Ancylobacter dichloromethanicus]